MIDIHNYCIHDHRDQTISFINCSIMYFVTESPKNDEKNCRMSKNVSTGTYSTWKQNRKMSFLKIQRDKDKNVRTECLRKMSEQKV